MKQDPLLNFVKAKLEHGEGLSDAALARLLDEAERQRETSCVRRFSLARATWDRALTASLLAASLAVATCGWLFHADAVNARRESNLAAIMELLRTADGESSAESASIAESLLAWQDAPTLGYE